MKKEEKIEIIISILCDYYNLELNSFNSKSRKAEIVQVRHIATHMIRYELGLTFREIGEIGEILNKKVSTIIRNFQNISDIIRHDSILKKDIHELRDLIRKNIN